MPDTWNSIETIAPRMKEIFKERGFDATLLEGKSGIERKVRLIAEDSTDIEVRNMSSEVTGIRRIRKWSMLANGGGAPRHGDSIIIDGKAHPINGHCAHAAGNVPYLHYLTSDQIEKFQSR